MPSVLLQRIPPRVLLIPLVLVMIEPVAADQFRVHVLDVGEGQAVVLQRDERGVLVDTGHLGKARYVLDRLEALGIEHLDYLIITHLHPDHASGYFRIKEAFPRTTILDNGQEITADFSSDTVRWIYHSIQREPNRRIVTAGDVIQWQNTKLRVLWPDSVENENLNNNSLVVATSYGNLATLIMGDVGEDAEQQILRRTKQRDQIALLVAGHHGAAHTSSANFLKNIQPIFSVISIDNDNIRGYPNKEVVTRLQEASNQLLQTYKDGEICLKWNLNTAEPKVC